MTVALDALRHVLELGPEDPVPATIKVEQAAKLLSIGRGLAYELARRGELPTIRLGQRKLVVPVARLLALLEAPDQGRPSSDGAAAAPVGAWSFTPPEPDHLEAAS